MTADPPRGEYPHLTRASIWVGKVVAVALIATAWGAHQYKRGLQAGVDMTLCGIRVGLATGDIPKTFGECRRRDQALATDRRG